MVRPLAAAFALAVLTTACKERPGAPGAAGSASASAPVADGDLAPAVEVTGPQPRYALADLTDKQLEKLVARAGWTPTVVGKSPPSEGQSTIRVGAFQKAGGMQFEAAVLVRCKKQEERAPAFQPGEAYYRDGTCTMNVAVHLGIRNKSSESKRLLEALLAASPD